MTRDLTRLTDETFDLVVIGAGIYGVTIAWDAVLRGLSVALIDRGDFGAATSFNSHKTVHGGLRAVQQGNLPEMRKFVRERRALSRIAPHLVHPLTFLIPTTHAPLRSRAALRAALTIHNIVSYDRNDLADTSKHLPPGRVISRAECLRLYPGLEPEGVTGGALWHDCQMYNADRVTLAFVQSAAEAGAAVANYVEVTRLRVRNGRIHAVDATDRLTSQPLSIQARLAVNATGPWAGQLLGRLVERPLGLPAARLSRAMNLVTSRPAPSRALGGVVRGRLLFLVPWRGRAVFGTSHEPNNRGPDALAVTATDVDRFLGDLREAFPATGLERGDVTLVHRGLLPSVEMRGDHVRLLKQSRIRDHREDGIDGLISVLGVRYTTARCTAERTVDLACTRLGHPMLPCSTEAVALTGGSIEQFDTFLADASAGGTSLDVADLDRLVRSYGSEYGGIVRAIEQRPEDRTPLGAGCAVTRAEIRHASRHELACTLADAVLRRTEAASAGHPGADALAAAAAVMADERDWDETRQREEIDAVERVYRIDDS